MTSPSSDPVKIGVLALQGAFAEHKRSLAALNGVQASEVRTPAELSQVDGLVIPGGESTTMSLIAAKDGMVSSA